MPLLTNKILKLYYVSPRDMRKTRADAVHIMYSCAAFANHGIDVELVAPKVQRRDHTSGSDDVFDLYDVPRNFTIVELNTRIKEVNNNSSSLVIVINKIVFTLLYILGHLSSFRNEQVVVYSKCYVSILPYIFLKSMGVIRCKLVFETPFLRNSMYHRFIMKRVDSIVVMTTYVYDFLINNFKISSSKVIKSPVRFQSDYQDKTTASRKIENREYLNWDNDYKYVVYAGKAGNNTNRIKLFAEASDAFDKTKFVIVGASERLQKEYSQKNYSNLLLYPFQTYPEYLKFVGAADVLVATYDDTLYNRYTLSPGKGGAYLQSENPVVFTDLPCLRNRFPGDMVSFVKPGDKEDLVANIKEILDNYESFKERAKKASSFSSKHTFTQASSFILNEMQKSLLLLE